MRKPTRRRGFALPMAVVYSSLILATWCVANRQTAQLLSLKEYQEAREEARIDDSCRRLALAHALALLESGTPPDDGTMPVHWLAIRDAVGNDRIYMIEFDREDGSRWVVGVRAESEPGAGPGTPMPARFGPPDEPSP